MSQDDKLSKLNKDLEKNQTSLKAKMSDLKDKISRFQKYKNTTILCDTSGSMGSYVDHEKRAIDVVNEVLLNFKGCNLWEFNSAHTCNKVEVLGNPRGGTAMAQAFARLKAENIKEFILITDGAPDSEQLALQEAKGLKINIIYIGPPPAPAFLQRLANLTSGQFVDVELIKLGATEATKEIENKIRLMLNA